MTHLAMSPEARAAAGIGDGLLRLSVGIEDAADLVADMRAPALDRALADRFGARRPRANQFSAWTPCANDVGRSAVNARVAVLGVGTVGSALLDRLDHHGAGVDVVLVSNSRQSIADSSGIDVRTAVEKLRTSEVASDLACGGPALGPPDAVRIVVDATASPAVAARHAHWLVRGIHVVTASKLANGGCQTDADALVAAARVGRCEVRRFGHGRGRPAGPSEHRGLRAGGDEITRITGVLSGSLAWILDAYASRERSAPDGRTRRGGPPARPDRAGPQCRPLRRRRTPQTAGAGPGGRRTAGAGTMSR